MTDFSIVIPVRNEEGAITDLLRDISVFFANSYDFEVIVVDDNSSDNTLARLKELKTPGFSLKIISLPVHSGQSQALLKGIKEAVSPVIGTLDGDGQNPPGELKRLFEHLRNNTALKMVTGVRKNRKDSFYKRFISFAANLLRRLILGDNFRDISSGIKVFYRSEFQQVEFSGNFHRYLPYLFSLYGWQVEEFPVFHRIRRSGVSKYGTIDRLAEAFKDISNIRGLRKRVCRK